MEFKDDSEKSEEIVYRGKRVAGISLEGFPYIGGVSMYEEIKRKGEKFQLDDFSINDLLDEASAYEHRFGYHLSHPRDTKKAIADLDMARAILSYITRKALSEEQREKYKPKVLQLDFILAMALTDYIIEQPNYCWARQVIKDEIEEIEKAKDQPMPIDYEKAISVLNERLKHIDIRERNFGGAISDIVPIQIPHKKSLAYLLKKAEIEELYEEAQRLNEKMKSIKEKLGEVVYPEIIMLGRKFLLEQVSTNATAKISKSSITICDPEKAVLIHRKGMFDKKPEIRAKGRELFARTMGIVHSNEIVFELGRFSVDIVDYL